MQKLTLFTSDGQLIVNLYKKKEPVLIAEPKVMGNLCYMPRRNLPGSRGAAQKIKLLRDSNKRQVAIRVKHCLEKALE